MKYIIIALLLAPAMFGQVVLTGPKVVPVAARIDSSGNWYCVKYTWDDLRTSAQGINPAGGAVAPTVSTATGMLLFPSNKDADVGMAFQLPHDFRQGVDSLHIHLHWRKSTTDTGFVRWQMKYSYANIGGTWTAQETWQNGYNLYGTTDNLGDVKHRMFQWTPISAANLTLSAFILVQIRRQSAAAPDDTYPTDAELLGVDIHYQRCGSFSSMTPGSGGQ